MPVGIHENMPNFTHHQINTTKGDTIYIFSDGFADQFGGPNQKKLKYRAFRDLLLKYQHKSMQEQKAELTDFLNNWQGILEQVDDILIIGIRY